ncbi:unnamed protein product [Symbiodinium sp. CCMP2592]|nr:unnamed protein product [Symbiodinium sp. CCMP2592]
MAAATAADFPLLRGGSKLLLGLQQILQEADSNDDEDEDSTDDWLRAALVRLVERQPKNLLQELKSLVKKAGRKVHTAIDEGYDSYEGGWHDHEHWHAQAESDENYGAYGWSQQQSPTFGAEWWTGWQQDASGWWFDAGSQRAASAWARDEWDDWNPDVGGWGSASALTSSWKPPASTTNERKVTVAAAKPKKAAESEWQVVRSKRQQRQQGALDETRGWHVQQGAWTPPTGHAIGHVTNAQDLGHQLDVSSGVAWVMVTDDVNEASIALGMVEGAIKDEDKQSLRVVFKGDAKQLEKASIEYEFMTVPGTVDGALRPRRWPVASIGSLPTLARLITRASEAIVVRKPPPSIQERRASTFVVRCECDRKLAPEAWIAALACPASVVRQWARAVGIKQADILDTFSPKRVGQDRVVVMLRVLKAEAVQSLVRASGRVGGEGAQASVWFADVLGTKEQLKLPDKVHWISWDSQESWEAYGSRVHKLASPEGVALGTHQLGVRMWASDKRFQPQACTWRLRGMRNNWDAAETQDLLLQLGRATSGPAASGIVPKSATLNVAAKATVTSASPSDEQTAVNDTVPPSVAKKRGRDEAAATDTMEVETSVEWRPSTGRVVENVGEGNCLWHCLAAFSSTPVVKRSHRQVRQFTVHCMRERSDELRPIWEAMGKFNDTGKPSQFDWEDYLKDQGTHGQWSGAFEVAAWAVAMNHRVWITTDTGKLHLINPDAQNEKAWVALRYLTEGHYELWADVREEELWTRACELSVEGRLQLEELLRGGGRPKCTLSDFASSRSDRASTGCNAGVPDTAKSAVQRAKVCTKVRRTLSDFASVGSAASATAVTTAKPSGSSPAPSGSLGTPARPPGPGRAQDENDDDKWHARNNHIRRAHAGVPKDAFSQLWTDHSLTITVGPCPQQLRIWTCSKCHNGIRDERRSEHQVQAAARRHLRECVGFPMTLRENLKRCSEQLLTRQLAGGTANSRLAQRRLMVDSYARGRHQTVELDKVRLGVTFRKKALWAVCSECTKCFRAASGLKGTCKPALRTRLLARKALLWQRLRLAKGGQTLPMVVRAMKLTAVEIHSLEAKATQREGVEPHPGPPLRGAFLNCGGLQGAYRALQHLQAARLSLLVLCETQACAWNHKQLTARFQQLGYRVWGFSGREGDLVAMDFSTLQAAFFWQRGASDNEGGLLDTLLGLHQLATSREVPWLALGDWNLQPQENTLRDAASLQLCAPRDEAGELRPSRFSSSRCIDYGLLTDGFYLHTRHDEAPLSDHRVLHFEGCMPVARHNASFLRPTASLQRPSDVAVDVEWQDFCAAAEGALSAAAKGCGHTVRSVGCRPKGSLPETLSAGEVVRSPDKEVPYKVRQYTKLLGRIHEARRQQDRGSPALWRNLRRTWPDELGVLPVDLATAANHVQAKLQHARDAHTRSRLTQWRRRMAQGGRAATQWLKSQVARAPTALRRQEVNGHVHRTRSVAESFEAMRAFWRRIWHRKGIPEELRRLREGSLSRPAGEAMQGDWRLEAFDEEVWECFLRLWHDWCERDRCPQAFRHCRQVMLPKEEFDSQGEVDVENMRPICVQPDWLLAKVDADTHGSLKGRSVEAAVLALDAAFATDGILVSLDMKKCFDYMSPELCLGILLHEGMHPAWARHLTHIWRHQRRWLQVQRWVADFHGALPVAGHGDR